MKIKDVLTPRDRIAAWLNLQQTTRVIQDRLDARLRDATGLAWPEFEVLWRLRLLAERPASMGELAAQLLASPSGLTRLADRLERDGLITRETPRDNRRVVQITLTDRGRAVLAEADRAFQETLQEAFSTHLSDEEIGWLRRVLRKLLECNDAWAAARCEPGTVDSGPG
jgi:DNA-binding MarR family transcriptional regulator